MPTVNAVHNFAENSVERRVDKKSHRPDIELSHLLSPGAQGCGKEPCQSAVLGQKYIFAIFIDNNPTSGYIIGMEDREMNEKMRLNSGVEIDKKLESVPRDKKLMVAKAHPEIFVSWLTVDHGFSAEQNGTVIEVVYGNENGLLGKATLDLTTLTFSVTKDRLGDGQFHWNWTMMVRYLQSVLA